MWKNMDNFRKYKETHKNKSRMVKSWLTWIVFRCFFTFPEIIPCFSTFSTKRRLNIPTRLESLFETGTWTGLSCGLSSDTHLFSSVSISRIRCVITNMERFQNISEMFQHNYCEIFHWCINVQLLDLFLSIMMIIFA